MENYRKFDFGFLHIVKVSSCFCILKDHFHGQITMFENDRKSLIQHETFGQTVLPDRSLLIGQKLVKNAKIENGTF